MRALSFVVYFFARSRRAYCPYRYTCWSAAALRVHAGIRTFVGLFERQLFVVVVVLLLVGPDDARGIVFEPGKFASFLFQAFLV